MIEGLNSVSDLLRLYKIKETLYLRDVDNADKPVHLTFVEAVIELYSNIFEYQARMTCYLSQSPFKRGIRGTLELDDWAGMLKKIKASSDTCDVYCVHLDKTRESEIFEIESTHMLQSLDLQKRILDILETSQTSRQQDIRNNEEAELLELLASNYKSDKESVSVRVPGTCEWFFKDDRFQSWRDSKHSRLLWVSAGPGCGKSVLSRSLIDERRVSTNALNSTVCYFFFKDGQEQRMSGADALSAILHQLFENATLIGYALPSAKSYGKKLRDNFDELWGVLMRCAKDSEAGDIICILDALDECEKNSRHQVLEKLASFSKNEAQESSCKVKFLVTSRPYDDLEQRFQDISTISTYLRLDGDEKSWTIGEEINLVIDHEMPRIAKGFSDQHCERISKRLKEMDNRNYLWLFLTLSIITASRSMYSKMSSIDSLLSSLPSKISDAYEEILFKSSDKATARILLQLIVAATRPLSLQEINIALTLASRKAQFTSHEVLNEDLWPPQNIESFIRNLCGLFVSVHDGMVFLIHQTAREFLLVRRTEPPESRSGKWQGDIDVATAHGTMSQICLNYLNLDGLTGISQTEVIDVQERGNKYHLLNYAAVNWSVHYTSQDEKRASDSWKAAHNLCNISLPQQSCWFGIYCHFQRLSSEHWTSLGIACLLGLDQIAERFIDEGDDVNAQPIEGPTALEIASGKGHYKVVHMLLDKGASFNVNTVDEDGDALYGASLEGHHRVVQLLLDRGADINAQGGYFGNALQAASYSGHIQIVQLLIDRGADVNAQGGQYGSALQAVSYSGHDQVVQLLLDRGADVNAQGGLCDSALQAASCVGDDQVVQLLLDKGADVNARGEHNRNALQAASEFGSVEVVRMLLDKGADVNARGGHYGNALQAASECGSVEVVRMLLDKGADINAQAGIFVGTALQVASWLGHHQVVQLLLDRGADLDAQDLDKALRAARRGGHDEIVQLLLDRGANISAQRLGGYLREASVDGQTQMVQVLLDKGPDVDAQDLDKALQNARIFDHEEIVQLLLDRGAKSEAEFEREDGVMNDEDDASTWSSGTE